MTATRHRRQGVKGPQFSADGAPHGLVFKDGAPGIDLLLPGQAFERRFDRPEVVDCVCSVHPYMTARVTARVTVLAP